MEDLWFKVSSINKIDEPLFKVRTTQNENAYWEFLKAADEMRGWAIFLGCLGFFCALLHLMTYDYKNVISRSIVWLIRILSWTFRYRRSKKLYVEALETLYHKNSIESETSFYDDRIEWYSATDHSEIKIFYNQCRKFKETTNYYIILFGSKKLTWFKSWFIISKDTFLVWNKDEFQNFIKQKIKEVNK